MEACLRLGIEPCELHFMPLAVFIARFREHDLAEIAYAPSRDRAPGLHPCDMTKFLTGLAWPAICIPCALRLHSMCAASGMLTLN